LAAGDSYSAGFGLPGVNLLSGCSRSDEAWPAQARGRIAGSGIAIDRFESVACSGAKVAELRTQLTGDNWDLVTFSIGGNDVGFAPALTQCIAGSSVDLSQMFRWIDDPVSLCPPDELVRSQIDEFGRGLPALFDDVARVMTKGGNVVVVGYPAMFETYDNWNSNAKVWGLCHGIDQAGAERVRGWAGHLNATIGSAVADADRRAPGGVRFTFVNVNDGAGNSSGGLNSDEQVGRLNLFEAPGATERHNLCGSDSWLFGIGSDLGLFHPNQRGHAAEAALVTATLLGLDWSGLPVKPPPLTSDGLGDLRIGMSLTDAQKLGKIGPVRPGCEFAGHQTVADFTDSGRQGSVVFTDGELTSVFLRSGEVFPGARIGQPSSEFLAAAAGMYEASLDTSSEEVFGIWVYVLTDRSSRGVVQIVVDPASNRVESANAPSVNLCD
jgi:hypothetical protein